MDRQETVLLLKEVMTVCGSFYTAKTVSIAYNKANDSWELCASWIPDQSEIELLNKIIAKHGLERVTTSECTTFRSKLKP